MRRMKFQEGMALRLIYGSGTQLAVIQQVRPDGHLIVRKFKAATRVWSKDTTIHPMEVVGLWEGKWPRGAKL